MNTITLYNNFFDYLKNMHSYNTAIAYGKWVREYLIFLNKKNIEVTSANAGDITDWIVNIRNIASNKYNGAKVSDGSKKQAKAAVKCFYDYLRIHDYIATNPVLKVEVKLNVHNKEKRALSADMIKAMVMNARTVRDKAMILAMSSSGMRISEITNILFEDYIKMRTNNLNYITIVGKGNKPRNIIFSNEVIKMIDKYIREERDDRHTGCATLFLSNRGNQVTTKTFWSVLKHVAKQAGVPFWEDISNHWLRVSCATNMSKHGVDIETIASVLGHSNIATTNTYLKATMEDMEQAVTSISFM